MSIECGFGYLTKNSSQYDKVQRILERSTNVSLLKLVQAKARLIKLIAEPLKLLPFLEGK